MPKPKTVAVELGGRLRTLRLDLNALCALEEVDLEVASLNAQLQGAKVRLTTMRKMLWAFLQTDSEDAGETHTVKQVGGWIDTENMTDVGKAVGRLLSGAPKADSEGEAENPTQAG